MSVFAVAAVIQSGKRTHHALWLLPANSAAEAEGDAMRAALRMGELRSLLVRPL